MLNRNAFISIHSLQNNYNSSTSFHFSVYTMLEIGQLSYRRDLDQPVLRSRDAQKCEETIILAKRSIRTKLKNRRGRRKEPGETPMTVKNAWAKETIRIIQSEALTATQQGKGMTNKWAKERWEKRREHYLSTIPESRKMPAHKESLGRQQDQIHQGPRKAESSLAIQLRYRENRICTISPCTQVSPRWSQQHASWGRRRQDPKHVVIYCPEPTYSGRKLYEMGGNRQVRMRICQLGKRVPGGS